MSTQPKSGGGHDPEQFRNRAISAQPHPDVLQGMAGDVHASWLQSAAPNRGLVAMDIVSPKRRSEMMAGIRSKNTRPEIVVRQLAHSLGLRFRLHRKDLPGSPDLVFPRWRLAVFVHGCFWHRHVGCPLAASPKTRPEFWRKKFDANVVRDRRAAESLAAQGWRVMTIWECDTRDGKRLASKLLQATRQHVAEQVQPGVRPGSLAASFSRRE